MSVTNNSETGQIMAVKQIGEDCKTFTCFPDLPIELRFKIIGNIASQPRNVDLYYNIARQLVPPRHLKFHYNSNIGPPAILHVNKEAREEAFKYYEPSFFTCGKHGASEERPSLYINWSVDRLCFVDDSHLASLDYLGFEALEQTLAHNCHGKLRSLGLMVESRTKGPRNFLRTPVMFRKVARRCIDTLEEVVLFEARSETIRKEWFENKLAFRLRERELEPSLLSGLWEFRFSSPYPRSPVVFVTLEHMRRQIMAEWKVWNDTDGPDYASFLLEPMMNLAAPGKRVLWANAFHLKNVEFVKRYEDTEDVHSRVKEDVSAMEKTEAGSK